MNLLSATGNTVTTSSSSSNHGVKRKREDEISSAEVSNKIKKVLPNPIVEPILLTIPSFPRTIVQLVEGFYPEPINELANTKFQAARTNAELLQVATQVQVQYGQEAVTRFEAPKQASLDVPTLERVCDIFKNFEKIDIAGTALESERNFPDVIKVIARKNNALKYLHLRAFCIEGHPGFSLMPHPKLTALHNKIRTVHLPNFLPLMQKGVRIEFGDDQQSGVLSYALRDGFDSPCISAAIESGSWSSSDLLHVLMKVNAHISQASLSFFERFVQSKKMQINAPFGPSKSTLLVQICGGIGGKVLDIRFFEILFKKEEIDVNAPDGSGRTPLDWLNETIGYGISDPSCAEKATRLLKARGAKTSKNLREEAEEEAKKLREAREAKTAKSLAEANQIQ